MRSFAGFVGEQGSRPDVRLLQHLGEAIRLPVSSAPDVRTEQSWGAAVVAHRDELDGQLIVGDGGAWLAGSIRLDDRLALVRELGDVPAAVDDYELVFRAWRHWGRACVEHLFGDYSFVVWNGATRELLAVRDRSGTRPFYFARAGRALIFSDTLNAMLAHPGVDLGQLDDNVVAEYLSYGVGEDAAATIYAEVRRLPPGHLFLFKPGDELVVRQYWTPTAPAGEPPRGDFGPHLEAALNAAIRDRVRGDAAMVFMSGGLDSTTLAALAHEALPALRITAGTSVYRSRIPDVEERYAVEAARSIGIPIHCFPMDDYSPLGALEAGLWLPEPGPLLMASMTRDVYAFAAERAAVAFHGHPADALLVPELTPFLRYLLHRGRILRLTAALLDYVRIRRRLPYFLLTQWVRPVARRFGAERQPAWLNPSFAHRLETSRVSPTQAEARGFRPHAVSALRSGIWSSYYEWAHPLMTGAAIELAYPFNDLRVMDVLLAAEPIPAMVDKHVLREMLRGRVSEMIRTRAKTSLQGDPWTMALRPDERFPMKASAAYVDASRFAEECRSAGSLADMRLRAVAFDYWLAELPERVRMARQWHNLA